MLIRFVVKINSPLPNLHVLSVNALGYMTMTTKAIDTRKINNYLILRWGDYAEISG